MSRRHRLPVTTGLMCLALVVLAMSGCTTPAEKDIDVEQVALGMRYRDNLESGGASVADLAETDSARQLDPCGMLDEEAVNALGTPLYFGVGQRLDECVVRFDRATMSAGITSVEVSLSVTMGPSGNVSRIGDRAASTLRSTGMCFIALQYNNRRAFHYMANAVQGVDPCTALHTLVTASAPLLDDNPQRADSTRIPKTRGATKDPCAALDAAFPPGQRFYLSSLVPYECDAWLDHHTRDDSNRFGIQVFNVAESQATYVPSHARKLLLTGVHSIEESGRGDYCIIHAYVGVEEPFPTRSWDGEPENRVEVLRVTGHGCTKTRELAVAAVKAYQRD
ncbi:hypothetical protein ACL02S_23275 [Nocardia sp. 004]|uniref:hypothetical protein n=1 Tax=Nocardia sp. 004 TaxID=3385978 RepID=UPI0039A34616